MVNVTSEAFKAVSTQASKVLELVSEVAEASGEQSQGIDQITKAMAEMDKVTQGNAATAEESASAAGQLSHQSENLLNVVKDINGLIHGVDTHDAHLSTAERRAPRIAAPAPAPKPLPSKSQTDKAADKALPMDDNFDF
jgi:methyl-accepting chemotaxis protein